MFERIVGIILPVFGIILVGYLYGRRNRPDLTWVNRISMNVLAPALVFSALSSRSFDLHGNRWLILASVGIVLGSGLLAWPFARAMHVDPKTWVPPMMFNNGGNMGVPLAVLAFGDVGLSAMVALFTISNLLHFTLGTYIVNHAARFARTLRSPMVIATAMGFLFALVHPPMPEWTMQAIRLVGDGMIPLMLLSLGVRMVDASWSGWRLGLVGAIVCPLTGLALAGFLNSVLDLPPEQQGLLYIFGSLPPAVLNFMVAEQYRQEPEKVASIVMIGNAMSILFVTAGIALALRPHV